MPEDDHSIDVKKGVYNTLDAKICTVWVVGSEASTFEVHLLTDWTTSAKPKDNGKGAW